MDRSLESLNLEVIYFLLCAVFYLLKVLLLHSRLVEYSDLHLIYSSTKGFTVFFTYKART